MTQKDHRCHEVLHSSLIEEIGSENFYKSDVLTKTCNANTMKLEKAKKKKEKNEKDMSKKLDAVVNELLRIKAKSNANEKIKNKK